MTAVERVATFRAWRQLVKAAPERYRIRFHEDFDREIVTVIDEWEPRRNANLWDVHLYQPCGGPGWTLLDKLPPWRLPDETL